MGTNVGVCKGRRPPLRLNGLVYCTGSVQAKRKTNGGRPNGRKAALRDHDVYGL